MPFASIDELESALAQASYLPDRGLSTALYLSPTKALGLTKRAMNKAFEFTLDEALDYEAHLQEVAGQTADHREGVAAFLARRAPNFTGQ